MTDVTGASVGNGSESGPLPLFGWRMPFYLILPSEIPHMTDVREVPNYGNKAGLTFLTLIALECVVKYWMTGQGLRLNDTLASLNAVMAFSASKFLLRGTDVIVYSYIFDHWRLGTISIDHWTGWILCALAADLGYYWFHRLSHEVNILWASHQTHHSSEDFNLSTALRQSMFRQCAVWIFYLPMAVVGFSPVAYLVHYQINQLFQFWIHTTTIKNLGILELFLNTPSHHRVHHGRNRYCIDKNYAGALIIWDRMFGTFEAERPDEGIVYGILSPINSFNGLWIQTNYYFRLFSKVALYTSLKNKLLFLIMGPGWAPGTPRLGNPEDLPDIRQPTGVYNVKIPNWKSAYCIVHFVLLLYFHHYCVKHYETWNISTIVCAVVMILAAVSNIGSLSDDRWWIPAAEIVRCLSFAGLLMFAFAMSTKENVIVQGILMVSIVVWIVALVKKPANEIMPSDSVKKAPHAVNKLK